MTQSTREDPVFSPSRAGNGWSFIPAAATHPRSLPSYAPVPTQRAAQRSLHHTHTTHRLLRHPWSTTTGSMDLVVNPMFVEEPHVAAGSTTKKKKKKKKKTNASARADAGNPAAAEYMVPGGAHDGSASLGSGVMLQQQAGPMAASCTCTPTPTPTPSPRPHRHLRPHMRNATRTRGTQGRALAHWRNRARVRASTAIAAACTCACTV